MKKDIIGDRVAIIWQGNENGFTNSLYKQSEDEKKFTVIDSYKKFHEIFLPQLESTSNKQFSLILILAELNWRKEFEQSGRFIELRGIELAQLLRLEYAVISPIVLCSFLLKKSLNQFFYFTHFNSMKSLGASYFRLPKIFINNGQFKISDCTNIPTLEEIQIEVTKVIFGIKPDTHNDSLLFHLIQLDNKLVDIKEGINTNISTNLIHIEGIIKVIYRLNIQLNKLENFPLTAFNNLIHIMDKKSANELRKSNLTVLNFFQRTISVEGSSSFAKKPKLKEEGSATAPNKKTLREGIEAKNYSIIHILYFPEVTERKPSLKAHIEVLGKVGNVKHLFITIFYQYHLEPVLKMLPSKQKVNIWIHYNYGKRETNLVNSIYFFEKFQIEKYFITSGEVKEINQDLIEDGYHVVIDDGLESKKIKLTIYQNENTKEIMYKIYSNKIFTGKDIKLIPPPKTVKEIINSQFKASVKLPSSYPKQQLKDKEFNNKIKRKELATILAYCFKKEERDNKKMDNIEIIPPGFSGALLLKITFDDNKNYVIKLDQNKKNLIKEFNISEKVKGLGLSNERFVFSEMAFYKETNIAEDHSLQSNPFFYPILNWYGLRYELASNSQSLLNYLQDASLVECQTCLTKMLERLAIFKLQLNPTGVHISNKPIWQGNSNLTSLAFPNKGLNILVEIDKISFGADIPRDDLETLTTFIENKKKLIFLSKEIPVPTAYVHGDFHSGNILVDEYGTQAKLIDFALTNLSKKNHAFYDLAKLSVNLELLLISYDYSLFQREAFFDQWLTIHQQWLMELTNEAFIPKITKKLKIREKEILKKIYAINLILKKDALAYAKANGLNLQEQKHSFAYQFEIVRLHFFLKSIAYTNLAWQKRLFALKASLNIINYFKNENSFFYKK